MRWRTQDQHQSYPQITNFLSDLPRYLSSSAQVLEAFLEYSGLSREEAIHAATLGMHPLFQVAPIMFDGRRVNANGSHSNGLITLDLDLASEVEHLRSLTEGSARVYLYATSLHELVHYGRQQKGLSVTVNGNEAGKMFECKAYQGDIGWDIGSRRLTQQRSGVYNNVSWSCPLSAIGRGPTRLSWVP